MQLSNNVVSSLGYDVCHVIAFFVFSLYERVVWSITIELQLSSPVVQSYLYWTHGSLWIMCHRLWIHQYYVLSQGLVAIHPVESV
jgi:hypothetical protein